MRGAFFAGSAREKPPLTGEVAERSDGRRGFGRCPSAPASRGSTGPGMPGPYSAAKGKPAVTAVGGGVPDAPHSKI